MLYYVIKLILSAVVIVVVSELAKRSGPLAALIASLPLTSLLALSWVYVETGDVTTVNRLASQILWLVVPSLLFFVCLPILSVRVGYWLALIGSSMATAAAYAVALWLLQRVQHTS